MVKELHEDSSKTGLAAYGSTASKTFPQYLAAGLATLSAVALGTHLSWFSSALLMLQEPTSEIPVTEGQGSWIGSLITLGGCVGAIPAGAIATRLGPKRTLQIIALPLLAAWYIISFSGCVWGLYVARFLAGVGGGATCVAAPMYVAELAEAKIRGTLGTFFQLQITVGLLLGYVLGGTIADFKLLALISSAVPIVFLLTFSFMPESPVFLFSKGRIDAARKSLQFLRGANYDIDDELSRIRDNLEEANSNKGSIADLFRCRATLRAMVICLALMFFQQMSGINAVLFYAQPIFEQSGSSMPPRVCAIVVGVVQVVATYLSTLLIDRLGRKILLIISGSIMAICLGVMGLYLHLYEQAYDMSCYSFVPLVSIALYLVVFSIGYGPIPWMMMGELFSPNAKGIASSIAAAFNWQLAFAVTKLFQPLQDWLGSGLTFGIFGVVCAGGALFAILMVPETKGRDLQEIQMLLLGQNPKRARSSPSINDDCLKISIKN